MSKILEHNSFKENKEAIHLAELMAQQIYPKIMQMIKDLGMEEVRFEKINNWKQMCITNNYKLQFFTIADVEKKIEFELDLSGKKICALFLEDKYEDIKSFESPLPKYIKYCETIISKLKELEEIFLLIKPVILKIENINILVDRNVLVEKTKNE